MNWLPVSVPNSALRLLNKLGFNRFSKAQTFAALLHWYANLPLPHQAQLAQDYADQFPVGAKAGGGPSMPS